MKGNRMKRNNGAGEGGIGCTTAVGLIFIVLKLTGAGAVAEWSWWWVLSPFWLPIALGFVLIMLASCALSLAKPLSKRRGG